uniref:CG15247-PA n=1 Tax=Echinostoma caproni TaxID=27848 RepID=A0A183B057_9TREM
LSDKDGSPSPIGLKRHDWIRSEPEHEPRLHEPPASATAIHGPIINPRNSANVRATRSVYADWPDPPPSPPMGSLASANRPTSITTGLTPTPPKKQRRFFRFRSNTTSSRGTFSSREQIHSEPVVDDGYCCGILLSLPLSSVQLLTYSPSATTGFIEPSLTVSTENKSHPSSKRPRFGSRLQRLFRRSVTRRRKSDDHLTRSQSLERRLANSGADTHSIY